MDAKAAGKRGRPRALSDQHEWAVYARVVHGRERPEALAIEYGVTSRTILNIVRRRRSLLEAEERRR
jgi:hypothetical protein